MLAAVIVYMNGKPGGKNDAACNDAIDSGLKLVANGSLDGARQKLATAKNVCTGKSSAKADDLQAAIGKAGAINAALLSASILGAKHPQFHAVLKKFRAEQTDSVLDNPDPRIA